MLNERIVRKFIESKGETPNNSKYLLKDALGDGVETLEIWTYDFNQPLQDDVDEMLLLIEAEDEEILLKKLKSECVRRISMTDHDRQCLRFISDGTPIDQDLLDYAAAIRADYENLKSIKPVDFYNDEHWTPKP